MIQIYFLLILVVIVIVYLLLSDFFAPDKIIKKKFKSTPRKNITSIIKDGEKNHFSGSIEIVTEPLISPLSKRECALFSIEILKKSSGGKVNKWESIINKDVITTYLIKNNNNYVLIYSDIVECNISKEYEYKSDMFNSDNGNLTYYLNQYGFKERNLLGIFLSHFYKHTLI